jgi:hypothetical protein
MTRAMYELCSDPIWAAVTISVDVANGDARMRPDLEADFRNQEALLLRLIAERLEVADGTPAAEELDQQIAKVKGLVRSYQTVKWYERER